MECLLIRKENKETSDYAFEGAILEPSQNGWGETKRVGQRAHE